MKKLFAIVLAVIVLSCSACASTNASAVKGNQFFQQTQTNKEPQNDSTQTNSDSQLTTNEYAEVFNGNTLLAHKSALVLQISINPEFVVFITLDGTIDAVRCLNEDAEALFATTDVTGQEINTGIAAILSAAHAKGYLNETTQQIQIIPSVHNGLDWTSELDTAITQIITDFTESKGLPVAVSIAEPEITDTTGSFENGPEFTKVYEWAEDDGNYGTVYYGNDGKIVKRTVAYSNGDYTEETLYPNGFNATFISISADGTYEEQHHADNGYEKNDIIYHGTMTYLKKKTTDGAYSETYFDESGNAIYRSGGHQNGYYYEETTYKNGNTHTHISGNDTTGEYHEMVYHENGYMATQLHQNEQTGFYEKYVYYDDGKIATGFSQNQKTGEYLDIAYDQDGNELKYIETKKDGTYHNKEYYAAGKPKKEELQGTNHYLKQTWDQNGRVTYYYFKDAQGTTECIFDESGKMIKHIQNGSITEDPNVLWNLQLAMGF